MANLDNFVDTMDFWRVRETTEADLFLVKTTRNVYAWFDPITFGPDARVPVCANQLPALKSLLTS